MDISVIKADQVTAQLGITVGETGEHQSLEFINVRCPYSKKWFEQSNEMLSVAVSQGKLQRVIKLFDKEKPLLQTGNVMHRFVSKTNGQQAILDLTKIFETQDIWGDLSFDAVEKYAKETLNLTLQEDPETTKKVIKEAAKANIQFVPTIILGKEIFDENLSLEALAQFLK